MYIKVASAALVRALALVSRVAERKSTIPILSNVKIETAGDRAITLAGTDLEVGLIVSIEGTFIEPGAITIPAKRLYEYVRLLPDGDVSIKTDDMNWAAISSGKSRSRIAGMHASGFPELPAMPEPQMVFPANVLTGLFERTQFAISKEESRFTLNGALLDTRNGDACMVASDGHRLALAQCGIPCTFKKVLIPTAAIRTLPSLGEPKEFGFAQDNNHLWFRGSNGAQLVARQLAGSFPDYERVMPKEFATAATLNRTELLAALSRVAQFSDERSRCTRFELRPGSLLLSAASSESGESTEDVPCQGGGEIAVGLNAQYVADFLGAVDCEKVSIQFKDPNSAVEFRIAGDEGYRCVVMPMRLS